MENWVWIGEANLFRTATVNDEKIHGNVFYNATSNYWQWSINKYTERELIRIGHGTNISATKCVAAVEEFIGEQK